MDISQTGDPAKMVENLRDSAIQTETLEQVWNYLASQIARVGLSGFCVLVDKKTLKVDAFKLVPELARALRDMPANVFALASLGLLAFCGHDELRTAVANETVIPSIRDRT